MVAFDKQLTWTVTGQWSAKSTDGNYSLSKGLVNGAPRYVPYYIGGERSEILSNGLITAEAAKTVCETHYRAKHGIRQPESIRPTQGTAGIAEGSDAEKRKGTPRD